MSSRTHKLASPVPSVALFIVGTLSIALGLLLSIIWGR